MATRREFIKKGSLATLVGVTTGFVTNTKALGFEQLYKIPFEIKSDSVYSFSEANLKSFINSVFEVSNFEKSKFASLKLMDVSNISLGKKDLKSRKVNSFSMFLKGIRGTNLEQGIYELKNKELGKFTVLLVPVTQNENYYEVIFNNLRD